MGIRIRERRKELDMTLQELGEALPRPVSHASISKWERGKAPVPEDRIHELAEALNMSVEDLAGGHRFVTDEDMAYQWVQRVLKSENLSKHARLVLVHLPVMSKAVEGVWQFNGSLEDIAEEALNLELDEIKAVWDEVLASGLVEREGTAAWVLNLAIPR